MCRSPRSIFASSPLATAADRFRGGSQADAELRRPRAHRLRVIAVLLPCLLAATSASADVWVEVGDAQQLPANAQVVSGSGVLDRIDGTFTNAADADLFTILISDPASFSAFAGGAAQLDPALFLFTASGLGIAANDDILPDTGTIACPGSTCFANLPAGNALYNSLLPGLYLLGISQWDIDPRSTTGEIFPDGVDTANDDYTGVFGPAGPGGTRPVTSWLGELDGVTAPYSITLTGAAFVPEPSTASLLAAGLVALAATRRRCSR